MKEKLIRKSAAMGIDLTNETAEKMELFYRFLMEENQKFNLTGITAEDEAVDKHFIDSLSGAGFLRCGDTVADIGSGAGFPGIPLAALRTDCRFTLVDSLNKRVNFLNAAIERLGLENAHAVHARAEDLSRAKSRESFSVALARAVAPLNTLCEYCLPLVSVGGRFLAYKTEDSIELAAAQNAMKILGGRLAQVASFSLPETDIRRAIVVIEKIAKTPPQYPRGKNKEKTSPL